MQFLVVGISYKTASIDLREKLFLRPLERELILSELKSDPVVAECLILSTCNRTEIYAHVVDEVAGKERLIKTLFKIKKQKMTAQLKSCFYNYSGEKCIHHLFRVTTGLDSFVLGEKQILGQVKEAIDLSGRKGMMSKHFNILMNLAIRSGKKAQHETDISLGGVSVSWAAVKTVEKVLTTLSDKSILIMGAGKMSALTAGHFINKGIKNLYIMNRTPKKAEELACKFAGQAVSFYEIKDILSQVDVCICSVSAPHYLIDYDFMKENMNARAFKPLLCVDISTPRNIDPAIKRIPNVTLYEIDDLEQVIQENLEKRKAAIDEVEKIVQFKVEQFYSKLENVRNNSPILLPLKFLA